MTIETFSGSFHLNLSPAEDGTFIITGRHGHVYAHSDGELGVLIMPAPHQVRRRGHAREAMVAAGMTVRQNVDHEGTVSFVARNRQAAKLALKMAGIERKRTPSSAQFAALSKARSFIAPSQSTTHAAL